jgi:membrane protease YdiL (CAAX protease family)
MTAEALESTADDRALPAAGRLDRIDHLCFTAAIAYGIWVSPFIGGVRGAPTIVGWLAVPLLWLLVTRRGDAIGLGRGVWTRRSAATVVLWGGVGVASGLLFLAVATVIPAALTFVFALPALHRGAVGDNIVLFVVLIPAAHFVHELFYRGYLQSQLVARLASPVNAIMLAALLYAWTHVFIFSSAEIGVASSQVREPSSTLHGVIIFSFVESLVGGIAFHWTRNLLSTIAFRAANLTTIVLVLYPRAGLL